MKEHDLGFYRLSQIIGDKKRGIAALIPVSASTWWAGCKTGKYPAPRKLSKGVTVWPKRAVHALMQGAE